jgi:phage FluMu protein Com
MGPYDPQWKDYRKRFGFTLASWVLPPTVIYLTGIGGGVQVAAIAAWLLAFAVCMVWLFSFRCPRCREWFFIKIPSNHPFTKVCVHCGLRKWASSDPAAPAAAKGAGE